MALEWKLRKVMAERNIWTGAELSRLLQDLAGYKLSAPSISALINEQPKQVKAETMDALCMTLECTPNRLMGIYSYPVCKEKTKEGCSH